MIVVWVQDVVEIGVSCIGIQCISAGPDDVGVVQAHIVARSGAPILARAVVPGLVVTLFHCGTGTSVQYFSAASQYAAFLAVIRGLGSVLSSTAAALLKQLGLYLQFESACGGGGSAVSHNVHWF